MGTSLSFSFERPWANFDMMPQSGRSYREGAEPEGISVILLSYTLGVLYAFFSVDVLLYSAQQAAYNNTQGPIQPRWPAAYLLRGLFWRRMRPASRLPLGGKIQAVIVHTIKVFNANLYSLQPRS